MIRPSAIWQDWKEREAARAAQQEGDSMNTQREVRDAFWQGNEHLRSQYRAKKRQNDYNATIRCEFVDFVDMLVRDGHISESLAQRVTL